MHIYQFWGPKSSRKWLTFNRYNIDETKFVDFEHRFTNDHYFIALFIYCYLNTYSFPFLFFAFSKLVSVKPLNAESLNLDRLFCLMPNKIGGAAQRRTQNFLKGEPGA